MTPPGNNSSRQNALTGALVADAATMGLHWMYDQSQIDKVAETGDILFRQPDANVYAEQKAYFAHAAKKVGQNSQYGQSARVVAAAVALSGKYDTALHRQLFMDTFGPCGSYHGFADRPTKALVAKLILEGDDIADRSGSDDDQLPALCSVPALFAHSQNKEAIEKAVRVTTTNAQALSGAMVLHDCLERLSAGEKIGDALNASAQLADPELTELLSEALAMSAYDPLAAANHFGMPCHMKQGRPVAWHLLKHATDYTSVVRDNIRCGGDSCGRSMAVGSVAGVLFGVPDDLKAKLDQPI